MSYFEYVLDIFKHCSRTDKTLQILPVIVCKI